MDEFNDAAEHGAHQQGPERGDGPRDTARAIAKFSGYLPPAILAVFAMMALGGVGEKGWRALVVSFMFGYLAFGMARLNVLGLSASCPLSERFKRYSNPKFRFWVFTMLAVVIVTGLVLWSGK